VTATVAAPQVRASGPARVKPDERLNPAGFSPFSSLIDQAAHERPPATPRAPVSPTRVAPRKQTPARDPAAPAQEKPTGIPAADAPTPEPVALNVAATPNPLPLPPTLLYPLGETAQLIEAAQSSASAPPSSDADPGRRDTSLAAAPLVNAAIPSATLERIRKWTSPPNPVNSEQAVKETEQVSPQADHVPLEAKAVSREPSAGGDVAGDPKTDDGHEVKSLASSSPQVRPVIRAAPVEASPKALDQPGAVAPSPSLQPDGMSPALQPETMQSTHDLNEIAASAEQILPPTAAAEPSRAAPHERKPGANDDFGESAAAPLDGVLVASGALSSPRAEADLASRDNNAGADSVPAVHRCIETAFSSLPRLDNSPVSLVLSPDPNTQLALHLKLAHGQLQAQAVVERGDFAALKSDWGQLQSRLAEQGIRLAPLTFATGHGETFAGGHPFWKPREQQLPPALSSSPSSVPQPPTRQSGARTILPASGREWWA